MLRAGLETALPAGEENTILAGRQKLPRAFGQYELIEEIGRGGMGVVYKARQLGLGRTVAVKLLLAGAYSSEAVLRRFQIEAAAAAALQHPNIVAIHDYGEIDGQPYYAMDLVPGCDLAGLCAGRPLPARRAAELLQLLAGAVQYAHEHGVVHRDLKPSNVLVDEKGRPRIADFGLAKRLGTAEGATVAGQMLGSPSYAAPEQAAGRSADIGVASDVYGLGALFYHLLTGRAPFNAATPTETLRLSIETEPPPPRLLNPSLPRDLETICLKCLSKAPAQRYASASEVADDLERYLGNLPIRAQPPSMLYRVAKFTRRHRVAVAAVAAVFFALVFGLGLALIGFRRAVEQKRMAETARAQAQGLIRFIMKDLQPDMRDHGRLQSQKLTVEAAARYFDQLAPELRDEGTIRDQAAALEALAEVYGRKQGTVTIVAENIDVARDAAQRALVLRRQIAAAHPDDLDAALFVYADMARVTYNDPAAWTRLDKAFPDHIQKLRALEQRFPDNPAVQRALAGALSDWAYQANFAFGKPAEAKAAATESRERWQRLLVAAPDDKDVRIGYARSLVAMAQTFAGTEQSAQARDWGEKALAFATQLLESDATNLRLLSLAAETAGQLAWTDKASSPQKARDAERTAREHYRMLMTLDPATAEWSVRYAQMHNLEINALAAEGRLAEARGMLQEVIKVLQPAARDRDTKHMLATSVGSAASFALQAGDAAAVKNQLAGLNEFARACILALPDGSWERCAERLFWLVEQCDILDYGKLQDGPELGRTAREGLDQIERDLREFPGHKAELLLYRAEAQYCLGQALSFQEKAVEAVPLFKQAVAGYRDAPTGGSLSRRNSRAIRAAISLGGALEGTGDAIGAKAATESALAQAEEELKKNPEDLELRETAATAAQLLSYRTVLTIRSHEAELIAREHLRVLIERQPANPKYRLAYAFTYMMGCYYFSWDGQLEQARQAFREYDAQLEALLKNGTIGGMAEPFPRNMGFVEDANTSIIFIERLKNSRALASLAATAGDAADTQAHLEAARFWTESYCNTLPAGSPDRRKQSIDSSQMAAALEVLLHDWPAAARYARGSLDELEAALREQPGDDELVLRLAASRGLLGLALLRGGKTAEAAAVLPEALNAIRRNPPIPMTWRDDFWVIYAPAVEACVDWLAHTGDIAQARSLLERDMGERAAQGGEDPGLNAYMRYVTAKSQVRLAELLDPTNPADEARRAVLLDHAASILLSLKTEGRPLTADEKEALAKLKALRAVDAKSANR